MSTEEFIDKYLPELNVKKEQIIIKNESKICDICGDGEIKILNFDNMTMAECENCSFIYKI